MPENVAPVPAKSALITQKRSCPLCECKNRAYVDTVISELRESSTPVVDEDTGEILDGGTEISYLKIEQTVRELLVKLHDDTEFTLADLILHASQHALVTQISGLQVRSEGQYLFIGDQVFQRIDPKDALAAGIAVGLEKLMSGEMKITANSWVNMQVVLWRMMGNAGADEFIQAMIDKTKKGNMSADSPLGASYAEHQKNLERKQARVAQEEAELDKDEPEESDGSQG